MKLSGLLGSKRIVCMYLKVVAQPGEVERDGKEAI